LISKNIVKVCKNLKLKLPNGSIPDLKTRLEWFLKIAWKFDNYALVIVEDSHKGVIEPR
jgi:hypothetical protein